MLGQTIVVQLFVAMAQLFLMVLKVLLVLLQTMLRYYMLQVSIFRRIHHRDAVRKTLAQLGSELQLLSTANGASSTFTAGRRMFPKLSMLVLLRIEIGLLVVVLPRRCMVERTIILTLDGW